jgi:mannan endo-1,6-alpha-mannosidase
VGEQMSALSVFQNNLIQNSAPPVTANSGGTSASNPSAGGTSDTSTLGLDPALTTTITTTDKAGAGILTALSLVLIVAATWWMVV